MDRGIRMEVGRARRGLQTKFVVSLLIVGFTPGIVALFATYLYSTQALKSAIGDSFQQIASATARRIEMMIDDEIDGARHLAAAPLTVRASVDAANRSYRAGAPEAVRAQLHERSRRWERYRTGADPALPDVINQDTLSYLRDWSAIRAGTYQNILVTDQQGALVAGMASDIGFLHGDELWWREAYDGGRGRAYLSDIYEQAPGVHLLDLAVPVFDRTGTAAIGVVKLVLRRDNLTKAIMAVSYTHLTLPTTPYV